MGQTTAAHRRWCWAELHSVCASQGRIRSRRPGSPTRASTNTTRTPMLASAIATGLEPVPGGSPLPFAAPDGRAHIDVDLYFRQPDGRPWHPDAVYARFRNHIKKTGLPPTRLHDGRHGAATYAKAAGADLHDIKELLGHSTITITITSDTYTSLLHEAKHDIAEKPPRSSHADGMTPPRDTTHQHPHPTSTPLDHHPAREHLNQHREEQVT